VSNQSVPLLPLDGRVEPSLDLGSLTTAAIVDNTTRAARSEINASKAVIHAEDQLAADQQTPPDRLVDDDWIFTWRDYAGRVSNEDLQRLWGSVLAGEIKSPGAYSIRTLEFLRALSKEEAEKISKLARFAVEGRIIRTQQKHLDEQGVTFNLLLQMQDLGIVSGVEAVGLNTTFRSLAPDRFVHALRSHKKALIVEHNDVTHELKLEVYRVTSVGAQLLALGYFEPDVEYLRQIGQSIAAQGFTVQLADWRQTSEHEGEYFNAEKIYA
jgi:hypothetical protein